MKLQLQCTQSKLQIQETPKTGRMKVGEGERGIKERSIRERDQIFS
jgi:hypothetical protein